MLSGTNAVINKLFELGYEIDKSITSDIYKEFKKYAEIYNTVNNNIFEKIADKFNLQKR